MTAIVIGRAGSPTSARHPAAASRPDAAEQGLLPASDATRAPAVNSRRAAVAVMIFLAVLPLQWQVLAFTPAGIVRYFHIGAIAMVVLAPPGLRPFGAVLRELPLFLGGMAALTVTGVTTALFYGGQWAPLVQQATYVLIGLVFIAILRNAISDPGGRRLLVWTAPVAFVVLLIEFTRALRSNGFSPLVAVQQALVSGDPNTLIYGLFRNGFADSDLARGRASTRHEILAALLVAVFVTCLAIGVRLAGRIVSGVAVVAIALFVLAGLSRSILLWGLLLVLAVGARIVIRRQLGAGQLIALLVGAAAAALMGPQVGPVLYRRVFVDDESYNARLDAFSYSSEELWGRIFGGGPDVTNSTHTLITDTLFRSGWLACLAAVVVVAVIARYGFVAFLRYNNAASAATLAAVGAGTLVLVRAFTSGSGYLHLAEWVAFGIVVAVATVTPSPHR